MLARCRLLCRTFSTAAEPLRPSIPSGGGENFNKSVHNPARAVIKLLRAKPNNERVPMTSEEIWEALRADETTKHMRIHSFVYFKFNVLGPLTRDKRIRQTTKELPSGEFKKGWMTFAPKKENRQRRIMERLAMFRQRASAQDMHDTMWHDLLSQTHKDFDKKNDELSMMLEEKRAALKVVKGRLADIEGHADFE